MHHQIPNVQVLLLVTNSYFSFHQVLLNKLLDKQVFSMIIMILMIVTILIVSLIQSIPCLSFTLQQALCQFERSS